LRRSVVLSIVAVLATVACGGGEVQFGTTIPSTSTTIPTEEVSPTTRAPAGTSEIVLTLADDASTTRALVGDTIVVRLLEDDPGADPWILSRPPDPLVLGTEDVFVWNPSEPGAGGSYSEFVFFVLGPGETSLVFSRGAPGAATPQTEFRIQAVGD